MSMDTNETILRSYQPSSSTNPTTCTEAPLPGDLAYVLSRIPPKFPRLERTVHFEQFRLALQLLYPTFEFTMRGHLGQSNAKSSCDQLMDLHKAMVLGRQMWTARRNCLLSIEQASPEARRDYGPLLDLSPSDLREFRRGVMPKLLRLERRFCDKIVRRFERWEREMFRRYVMRFARLGLQWRAAELEPPAGSEKPLDPREVEQKRRVAAELEKPWGNEVFYVGLMRAMLRFRLTRAVEGSEGKMVKKFNKFLAELEGEGDERDP